MNGNYGPRIASRCFPRITGRTFFNSLRDAPRASRFCYLQQSLCEGGSLNLLFLMSGGKNSSTGNRMRLNSSQGEASVEPIHSFSGMQKSMLLIKSCVSRSKRMIENCPSVQYRRLSLPSITSSSSKQQHMLSGASNGISQQPRSQRSTSLTFRQMGSTTSTTAMGIFA